VPLSFLPLAVDREVAIVAALAALIVAALTVSFGAWFLLAREWRRDRAGQPEVQTEAEPVATTEPDLEPE
jgi:cytochrome oxidase assembly protein ShyY1